MVMNENIPERGALFAQIRNIPPASDRVYNLGYNILAFLEQGRRWISPFISRNAHGRMIIFQDREGT